MDDFNIADYDYLKELPLEGFMWEFVRRGKYKALHTEFLEACKSNKPTIRDYVFTANECKVDFDKRENDKAYIEIKSCGIEFSVFIKGETDGAYALIESLYSNESFSNLVLGLPNPELGYNKFKRRPIVKGAEPVIAYKLRDTAIQAYKRGKTREFEKYCLNTIQRLAPQDMSKTLYLGVSLIGRREDIINRLEKIVYEMVPSFKGIPEGKKERRAITDKWGDYLLVYDMLKHYKRYAKVSALLERAFPDKKFPEKTLIDWKYKASILIDGDYKNFIS